MSKLSDIFGRKDTALPPDRPGSAGDRVCASPASATPAPAHSASSEEPATDGDIGARMGEDHEALRNLLAEAERRIGEFEDIKKVFAGIVDPAIRALQRLEQEKTQNLSLKRSLGQLRSAHAGLHAKFVELEKTAGGLHGANETLRREFESERQAARELKNEKAEVANELAVTRAALAELERQQAEQAVRLSVLTEENQRVRDQIGAAETTNNQIETQLSAAREKLVFLEGDNNSLRKSLDHSINEASRHSQRLTESETAATAARAHVLKLEARLAELETERNKLLAGLNDATERYRAEQNRMTVQYQALESRAAMAEKLLANTRQLLATRVEEARVSDRRSAEAMRARDAAEKRLAEIEAGSKLHAADMRELEQSNARFSDRVTTLTTQLKTRDMQIGEAEVKLKCAGERISELETEMRVARTTAERRIDELNLLLENERLEHQVAEGALKVARQERSQLQSQIAQLRAALRHGKSAEPPEPAAEAKPAASEDRADAA